MARQEIEEIAKKSDRKSKSRNRNFTAFKGQTPDEMYYNTGIDVPDELAKARRKAMEARIEVNRKLICENCEAMGELEIAA